MLLRLLVFGAVLTACALAIPPGFILTRTFVLAVLAALTAALFPRTRAVGLILLGIATLWLIATTVFDDSAPSVWRVLGMAAALYVAHSAAAFAAVVPHECAVASAALLLRFRFNATWLVLGGAAIGLAARGVGLA